MERKQRHPATPVSAHDAERLLSGREPASADLADLHAALGSLRQAARVQPARRAAADQAQVLAHAALEALPNPGLREERRPLTRRSRPMRTRARIASAVGAALALFLGTAGAAMASQNAVPGDTLYGFKLVLEDIGLTEGGFPERLNEATVLFERGDEADALAHLADAIEESADDSGGLPPCPSPSPEPTASPEPTSEPSPEPTATVQPEAGPTSGDGDEECADDEASEELRRAAEAVLSGGSEQSLRVRTAVAEMLQWMATTDAKGRDFGQGVAQRARAINGGADDGGDGAADEDGVEGEEGADDGRGRPEHAGPPPGKGPGADEDDEEGDDEDGDDEGKGRPEHAGPPPGKGGGRP